MLTIKLANTFRSGSNCLSLPLSSLYPFASVWSVAADHSHLRVFSWVNSARLKPFMDSYCAPYKANRCYWPGLLLLDFALNPQLDSSINLQAILVGTRILVVWA